MISRFLHSLRRRLRGGAIFLCLCAMVLTSLSLPARTTYAATQSASAAPKISFTFDDGQQSALANAEPILAQYGLAGTSYIITNCVGMTTVPNACNANQSVAYMSWPQIQQLQADGWEIGSHTVDHNCLASSAQTDPSDCANPAPLTTAQVDTEMTQSKASLAANGVNATDFAPPYGDYSNNVMAQIAKSYATMRQFKNDANNANVWPYSDYYLQDFVVQERTDTVATIESAINKAIASNQWLILTFHDIEASPSRNPDDYQYGTAELTQIAAYAQAKIQASQLQNVTISQGLVNSTENLMPNASFNSGIGDGWTTDDPAAITADSGNNGNYPDSQNAVKLTSGTSTGHLFSPKIAVTPGTQYMFKSFLNLQNITVGAGNAVGYYIDEYDANGNWISGQWKTQEANPFVEDMNFAYTPSSAKVTFASLQVIVSGNAGITAYIDNMQMFPLTTPVTPTNLVANGGFDGGISGGWTTDDPSFITADSNNNGAPADPTNSVSLRSGTRTNNGHLFSLQITVDPTKTYNLTAWLNLKQLTNTTSGEVGFYIDEYDANGNWISGQYKLGIHTPGTQNVGFTYTPGSSTVAKASLQVIVVSNAGIQAYLDDVNWVQQ